MPTIIKGKSTCSECGSTQDVKHDGRKFFITCAECRTMTSYQSKEAKARIEKRLIPIDPLPEAPEIIEPNPVENPAEKRPKPAPTPARAAGSFLDSLNELF